MKRKCLLALVLSFVLTLALCLVGCNVKCDHVYDEGVVTLAATCLEDGVLTYTCTKCGETKTEAIANLGGHKLSEEAVLDEETDMWVKSCVNKGCDYCETEHNLHTVKFVNNGEVVAEYQAKMGDFVEIPANPTPVSDRYTFMGWAGVDSSDMEAGEVEVFTSDLTFEAVWHEQFGSSQEFTATAVRNIYSVTVDGSAEDAWIDAEKYALDEAGSTVQFLWEAGAIYIFANVVDGDASDDVVEVIIDLLHSEQYVAASWNGRDWGGSYRSGDGVDRMVEGGYRINAGSSEINEWTYEWLSHGGRDTTSAVSVLTETGYTMEMKIACINANIPNEFKPYEGQVIGLGLRNKNNSSVAMEQFDGYMTTGPKGLSNVKLVANQNNDREAFSVIEIRENRSINVNDNCAVDPVYKDATAVNFGETTVTALWSANNLYLYTVLGAGTASFRFEGEIFGNNGLEFTTPGATYEVAIPGTYELGRFKDINIIYIDGDVTVENQLLLKPSENFNNFGRNLHTASKLGEGESITVDGVKDSAYATTTAITVGNVFSEKGTPDARGTAYIKWDDGNIYVFVEVTDDVINSDCSGGDKSSYDSVEFWLSTCQTVPAGGQGWGGANRPYGDYCGEGLWRVQALDGSLSGAHWMYDWADGVPRECVRGSLTDAENNVIGYTVEYKIAWSAFGAVENKVGQVIDIMITINDNDNNGRVGMVTLNSKGQDAWIFPTLLDQLELVA